MVSWFRAAILFAAGYFFKLTTVAMAVLSADETVTIYPTYGYQQENLWVIPVRLWVHERRVLSESVTTKVVARVEELSPEDLINFRSRIQNFLADSESREVVTLSFDGDPQNEQINVTDAKGLELRSDLNGLIEGTISLTQERAKTLLVAQKSRNGWLTFSVTSKGHSGHGRLRLIDAEGVSVISDIDDTIKVTEVSAGPEIVMRNTFLRPFKAVPEMSALYQGWGNASFHYVSGSPWQMYDPLSEFLIGGESGFPDGSFHMKTIRQNLFSTASWQDLTALVTNQQLTYENKVAEISRLMQRFPRRQFILVGDSGEKDPEVYREIQMKFPTQVREIWIRDVVNAREHTPDRLSGMNVIPATTVLPGVSEFSDVPDKN